ncbi:AAEL008051-PA [Aedes aegypti]|uniref:AAEL008051-PA n=1 Tax=Aedes aegypti TaxID=7159 RepID=Q16ZV2_AEDAE|nr:AAEL008051-PA [Aedes aegypti]
MQTHQKIVIRVRLQRCTATPLRPSALIAFDRLSFDTCSQLVFERHFSVHVLWYFDHVLAGACLHLTVVIVMLFRLHRFVCFDHGEVLRIALLNVCRRSGRRLLRLLDDFERGWLCIGVDYGVGLHQFGFAFAHGRRSSILRHRFIRFGL